MNEIHGGADVRCLVFDLTSVWWIIIELLRFRDSLTARRKYVCIQCSRKRLEVTFIKLAESV